MSRAVKPAHYKATWNATTGVCTTYACMQHEAKLREQAEDRARVLDVSPAERDSASAWCTYCMEERA